MSDVVLFSIGFILFIFATAAILMFGYSRFNELYARDRSGSAAGGPLVVKKGNFDIYSSGDASD